MQIRFLAYLDSRINSPSNTLCHESLIAILQAPGLYSHLWGLSRIHTFFRPGRHMSDYNWKCLIDIWVNFIQNGSIYISPCDKIVKSVTFDHLVRFNDDFEIISFHYIKNNKSMHKKDIYKVSTFCLCQERKCIDMTHLYKFHNCKLNRMGIRANANCDLGQFTIWPKV